MKNSIPRVLLLSLVCGVLFVAGQGWAQAADQQVAGKCMTCHKEKSPGLYRQWYASEHAKHNVTCLDCHQAARADADAYEHEGGLIYSPMVQKLRTHLSAVHLLAHQGFFDLIFRDKPFPD